MQLTARVIVWGMLFFIITQPEEKVNVYYRKYRTKDSMSDARYNPS